MKLQFVRPDKWGKIEDTLADTPWILAKDCFVSFVKDPCRGLGQYEHVGLGCLRLWGFPETMSLVR
jgi:hypothetical protein